MTKKEIKYFIKEETHTFHFTGKFARSKKLKLHLLCCILKKNKFSFSSIQSCANERLFRGSPVTKEGSNSKEPQGEEKEGKDDETFKDCFLLLLRELFSNEKNLFALAFFQTCPTFIFLIFLLQKEGKCERDFFLLQT